MSFIVWPTINHSPDSPFLSISIFRVRLILLIAALRAAGALSDDGASIFVAGGSSTFHSINTMTGDVQWSDNNGESLYISEPKISKITQGLVYAIEVRLICPSLLLVLLSFNFWLLSPLFQHTTLHHSCLLSMQVEGWLHTTPPQESGNGNSTAENQQVLAAAKNL